MDVKKARKRPAVLEYVDVTEQNLAEVAKWCNGDWCPPIGDEPGFVVVPTLEGTLKTNIGYKIMHGLIKEFYGCNPESFEKGYDSEIGGPGMRLHKQDGGHAAVCDCGARFAEVSIRTAVFRWSLHALEAHREDL